MPVFGALRRLQEAFLGALMLAMSFAYGGNVLVREVTPQFAPYLAWIDEICLFGLAWMVFLGLSIGLETGRHISMRMLMTRLPERAAWPIKLAINTIGAGFSLYLAKIGYDITIFVANSGQASPTLNVSMAWLYWVMPVGFTLLALAYLAEIFTSADRFRIEIDPLHHV